MFEKLKKIPEQLTRLAAILIIIIAVFIYARVKFVPSDFGEMGHYRTSAITEIVQQEIKYAGQTVCSECHDDIAEEKSLGYHKNLSCEVCHGPSANHVEAPDEFKPPAPRHRAYCPVCHEYLPSRPTGFPQIVSASHNPIKACITCHNPHSPVPPETPKDCSACHAEIARAKAVSHHSYIECKKCHETKEQHKLNPRKYLPTKPMNREFCGQCHSEDADSEPGIPKIDLSTHEPKYVCWQCHYPHLPEAK